MSLSAQASVERGLFAFVDASLFAPLDRRVKPRVPQPHESPPVCTCNCKELAIESMQLVR
jgi:hypothetical protein